MKEQIAKHNNARLVSLSALMSQSTQNVYVNSAYLHGGSDEQSSATQVDSALDVSADLHTHNDSSEASEVVVSVVESDKHNVNAAEEEESGEVPDLPPLYPAPALAAKSRERGKRSVTVDESNNLGKLFVILNNV